MIKMLKIKGILNGKVLVIFCVFLSLVFSIFSCKKGNYLPNESNAFLARLKFSEGLKLEEEFDSQVFEYNLNIKKQQQAQSLLSGFFVICIPDNPASKFKISISGKVKINELKDTELPFNKELPIPFVPLQLKLKTSNLFPNLPKLPGAISSVTSSSNSMQLLDTPLDPPIVQNDPNLSPLPFDPNDPTLPELPINPNDPNFPSIPEIPNLPEHILIELTSFDLKIVVTSPDKREQTYVVHGKAEK